MSLKTKDAASRNPSHTVTETVIHVTRDGEWLLPEEFRVLALSAANAHGNLIVDLDGVDHLDASASQILLALAVERKRRGRGLGLENVSTHLSHWFEYAGGREHISPEREA
jgi:anti-anti-sigma regulatory factor